MSATSIEPNAVVPVRPQAEPRITLRSFLPAIVVLLASGLMLMLRVQFGGRFMPDSALMMIALACYLTAAVFHLMNLYAPSAMALRVGMWTAGLGVFFNLSSWLVRWVAAYDRELQIFQSQGRSPSELGWVFRYIPFANLYDLSLAFAFGAGFTTLLIAHRKNFRFLGAITLPLAALILVLARFIGSEINDLQPVLDSYWRPIHVGIASLSYGVALVCFSIGVVYLIKDGVKIEAMAIWAALFGLAVIATVSKGSVFLHLQYGASTYFPLPDGRKMPLTYLRADIPWVGPALALAGFMLIGVIVAFGIYLAKNNETAKLWGHRLLKGSLVVQACAIALLVSQVKTMTDIGSKLDPRNYEAFGKWLAEQDKMTPEQIAQIPAADLISHASQFVAANGSKLILSLNANPVELAALITVLTATLFVLIFSFRTERLRQALPALDKLDSLLYKTGSVTFAMLAMLLITGAIWANESWGKYWQWDSKETGAFVAWLTYGVFLHTRIARGWSGRRSAYFALLGFLFIIFTYLGVSYLLPGLHSYA
ncbi:MAG: cytochrome c biogenesis protein CcsA [Pyrinomonadaceae bacterium]